MPPRRGFICDPKEDMAEDAEDTVEDDGRIPG